MVISLIFERGISVVKRDKTPSSTTILWLVTVNVLHLFRSHVLSKGIIPTAKITIAIIRRLPRSSVLPEVRQDTAKKTANKRIAVSRTQEIQWILAFARRVSPGLSVIDIS